jgi:ABC-2 type transport system permease protein
MTATTWQGVRSMAEQEFRLRLRSGRWIWLLTAWFVVLLGFTLLEFWALSASLDDEIGTPMFGGLMLFLLALGLLVVPALTCQSINGDRERGVLAPLQITLLTPREIAVGKLLAGWGTALVFLLAALPMVLFCLLMGGVGIARVVVTLGVVALLLGAVAAISLGWSALMARTTTSTVLSYLTVFALTVGTLITFGLALAATTTEERRGGFGTTVQHPERVWWLLAPNPFVVLADAAPRVPPERDPITGQVQSNPADPLGGLSESVRLLREPEEFNGFGGDGTDSGPVWPYGLAANLLLGAGGVTVATRRLQTPYATLPRGVRVA